MDKYRIGRVYISSTSPEHALKEITRAVKEEKNDYVCVSNVRTVGCGYNDPAYRDLMNNAYMCTPDGMPLVWMARLWGLKNVQRTVGPDLFIKMLNDKQSGIKHFLLGDTDETLSAMLSKYKDDKGCNIVGVYSPPYCKLEDYNYKEIADIINRSGADIVWVSLGAPKQDFFAKNLLQYTQHKMFIGVGAAFRFSLGIIKHPPKLIKQLGLTGLFWRKVNFSELLWYVKHIIFLFYCSVDILYSRIRGERPYGKK